MFGYCKHHGIGIIPYSPLAVGALSRPFGVDSLRSTIVKGTPFEAKYSDADKEIISRVEELAKKKQWKMSQVALAWSSSKTTSPIVGITQVSSGSIPRSLGNVAKIRWVQEDRLIEAILGNEFVLSTEEIAFLEEP